MTIEQNRWTEARGWEIERPGKLGGSAQLVLVFGSTSILKSNKYIKEIKKIYPNAPLFGCSTAGEICGVHYCESGQETDARLFSAMARFII